MHKARLSLGYSMDIILCVLLTRYFYCEDCNIATPLLQP